MTESDASVTLLCLGASHINNLDRLQRLGHLLASVSAQETKNFKLYLGISFERAEFRKVVEGKLRDNDKNTIHVFIFKNGQTQFERYSAILKALRDKRYIAPDQELNTYLSFTDDDDLWSPQRMSFFLQGAKDLHADKRNPKYMFNTTHFEEHVEEKDFSRWDQLPVTKSDFYQFPYPREYCDIVCKFSLFAQFFTVASPEMLAHQLCDLMMTKWIVKTATVKDDRQREVFMGVNCSHPLYYCRQSLGDPDYSVARHTPERSLEWKGMSLLLDVQLRTPSATPLPDDDAVNEVMRVYPGLPRSFHFECLKTLKALPLWHQIFVDLLGDAGC